MLQKHQIPFEEKDQQHHWMKTTYYWSYLQRGLHWERAVAVDTRLSLEMKWNELMWLIVMQQTPHTTIYRPSARQQTLETYGSSTVTVTVTWQQRYSTDLVWCHM